MKSNASAIRIVLVDDDDDARRALRLALEALPGVRIQAEFADGPTAIAAIRRDEPDLVFLDVEMPELDGLEVAASLGADEAPPIVFVTAYDRHAVAAFELHAVDYVLKPFEDERIHEATRRALRRIATDQQTAALAGFRTLLRSIEKGIIGRRDASRTQRFVVREAGRMRFVPVDDVDWIEAERNYVRLHVGAKSYLVRGNLSHIVEDLDPVRFRRIHRSTVANIDRIAEIRPWQGGDHIAILHDGTQLRVSRTWRRALLDWPAD